MSFYYRFGVLAALFVAMMGMTVGILASRREPVSQARYAPAVSDQCLGEAGCSETSTVDMVDAHPRTARSGDDEFTIYMIATMTVGFLLVIIGTAALIVHRRLPYPLRRRRGRHRTAA